MQDAPPLTIPSAVPAPDRAAVAIRPSGPQDVDALVVLEEAAFTTDRLSRRSFRRFVSASTACLLVAENDGAVLGYGLVLFRAGTALARLYSLAVAPAARGLGLARKLVKALEHAAYGHGCIVMRLEVRADNDEAIALYLSAGYRRFGRIVGYYEDGADALRFEKRVGAPLGRSPEPVPFYEQTTDFTCGPACIVMCLVWAGMDVVAGPRLEVKLWRESTTIFMASGHGGCEPLGLAVTLANHGLLPEVFVNRDGPYFLDGVRSAEKREVMVAAQEEFREAAADLDIPVRLEPLGLSELLEAIDAGALAIVLVSGYRMFARKVPHWVLVVGHDEDHVFVNDPWVEDSHFETHMAAANLPIPFTEFQRMAKYGQDTLRAAILVRRSRRTEDRFPEARVS